MRVLNRHRRVLHHSPEAVGECLDTLSRKDDRLWPHERWPRMVFKGGVAVGKSGGHGPIRYTVEGFEPGRMVVFRFTGPRGFDGYHKYEIEATQVGTELRHSVEMRVSGPALLTWPLIFGPLHDALMKDSLDKVEADLSGTEWEPRAWSPYVRVLRKALASRRKVGGRIRPT